MGSGKRIGNGDSSERSNRSCDASGHSANAGRPVVHSADDPCGRRIVRHPRGLWIWRRSGSLAASTQTLGPLDDWKSERIVQRNPFTWTCQAGRAARSSGTIGGLVEALHAKKRRTEWSAPYVGRRHQDGGVGRRHCQLQRSRTYQKLSGEVVLYAEARGYVAPKLGQVSKAREDRDDPMDVEGFGQWKGRTFSEGKRKNSTGTGEGKGTGKDGAKSSGRANTQKIQGQCWSCGKTGHQSKDCWARPQQQSQGQSNSLGKGNDVKGKSGKGGGKKGKSKYVEALVWNQQPSPVASSVASSTPQTETSTTVGTVDAIECTAFDLCATALTQQEIVNSHWIAFNMDTGAGGTVWPMNADYACETFSGPAGRNCKTATGEMVEGQGPFRVRCQSVWEHQLHMTGEMTSDVTDKGHALWLDGNVGYIIQKYSPILTAMRTCFQRVCEQHSGNGAIDLTKERGVYNLYVQVAGGDGSVERAVDVSPNEMEVDESGHRASGCLRLVNP